MKKLLFWKVNKPSQRFLVESLESGSSEITINRNVFAAVSLPRQITFRVVWGADESLLKSSERFFKGCNIRNLVLDKPRKLKYQKQPFFFYT